MAANAVSGNVQAGPGADAVPLSPGASPCACPRRLRQATLAYHAAIDDLIRDAGLAA